MAKPVLIATDIIEAAGRGDSEAVKALEQAERHASPAIGATTQIRLANGCEDNDALDRLLSFLRRFDVLPLDQSVSEKAIELWRGHNLDMPTALIAATAIVHGRSLVTGKPQEFEGVKEIISIEAYPEPFAQV